MPLSGTELIANCQRLWPGAAVGMPVIYVRVSRRLDLKDAPAPPGTPPGGGAPSLIEDTDGAAIVAELAPRPEDVVITSIPPAPSIPPILGCTSGGSASRP